MKRKFWPKSMYMNFVYAIFHWVFGISSHSWWFITLGAYYFILAVSRFSVIRVKRRCAGNLEMELFAKKITGILFIFLSLCLAGIALLSVMKERGVYRHEILMITIATFTFVKITFAIIGIVKAKKIPSPVTKTLRNISLAEAIVSVYSMQRSMLVSFEGMEERNIQIMNLFTGTAVWLFVLLLGINLIGGKRVNKAKSKIVEANKRIAKGVVGGYKTIENGVVDGYKKIQDGVVGGYMKIEDYFVDTYLKKDGETVEEAKERLKNHK